MAQNDKYIQSLIESIKKKEQGAIKPTYDPAKQAEGLERRLEGSGVTAEKRDSRNFIEKALNLTPKQNVLFDIFEIINRPQQMLFQGIKAGQEGEDVGKAIRKGFGGVGKEVQFKEILQNAGMEDSGKDIGADDIFGFVGDVLVDPIDLALVVATPFTGGASGAALAAKKGIQAADSAVDAYKAANTAFDLAKAAGKLDNAADLAKATKSLEKARVLANKANETKKLWQNLDVAAKNLNDIRASVKSGGSVDGLADAFDAYKKALQPLKKRMTPLEYVFKQTKGGIKKSVNLIDNGVTGVLSKLDGKIHELQVNKVQGAITPEVADNLVKSFEAIRPWSTKYKDMKVAFNSIFDAAKALPDGLWNKTKEITGSRKQAMARMVKLNQLNVDEIQKVAKVTGVKAQDIQTMLMRAYELERYNPTTKLADLFDLDYITNNPMTDGNFKAFKDYIYDALKNENGYSKYSYNQIDELFQKRTLENGVEAWFVRPDIKNQSYIKAMLKDMRKYMDDSVKGFEKADIRIDKLQKRIAEVENIRNAAADEILATAGRYVQDADGNVKVVLTTDEVADLKKLGINFKEGSVITHDQALKAVNGRIKKTTEKIKEISPKVNYTDLKDEAAKMVLPDGKPDLAEMGKRGRTFLPDDETQKVINKKVAAKWGTEDVTSDVIKKRLDNNGGITVINGKAIDADKGFQVAYDKTKEVPVDTIDDVLKYVKENNVESYGVWYNDKINKYVIDTTSTYTDDAYAAAAAGLFGKQDAIMSWADLAKGGQAFPTPDEFANTFVKSDKIKIGKKLYEPEDAKKYLNQFNDKLNATKAKLEADKLKYGKVAKDANLKTTKLQSKLDELRKTRPNTDFENEIKASRYYSDNDIREVTDFFDVNKSPEMAELKANFAKRYDAMYEDLNAVMGVVLTDKFDAGYLRHVKTNEMRKFLDELDGSGKAFLKKTAIVGDTNKFRGRAFQMSAYEANMVSKEIQLNILENAKLSDEVKAIVTEASVIDMFEEDAATSIWDFISKGTDVIEKGQKIEAVMSASLRGGTASLWDENLLKPFKSMKDVDNATQQVINSREIIDKLNDLAFTFKDEELMKALAQELGKSEQLVIDKNLYNLISFNTSKDINSFADSMVKIIDSTNKMFKKYKLLSPGFQIRNLVGNMTNILLAGVNPLKILDNNVLAHRILSQGDDLLMKRAKGIPLSAGETQMLDLFEEFTRKGFDQVFGAGNIENLASVYDIPEDIMKAMRAKEKPKGLKRLMEFNGRMNEYVDRQFRMSAFIYAKQNPEILARVGVATPEDFVRKVLFDPNDLSKVERQYLKRLIPFYTFTKKNLAYQMSNVWDNPNRYNKLMKSVDASWKMIGIDPKEEVEQYKRENMWIPVFVNKNGEYKALKANLPVGDFAEFLSDPFKKVVSSTAPVIRSPFEMTMNTQAFTGMPIQEFKGQRGYQIPWASRKVEYGLSQLGLDVPIAAATDIAQGVGQVAGGDVGGGIEKAIGRSFLSSGSVEKAKLSRDYDRLNELRDLMKYYKQEGVRILTLDEIESLQQQKSQTILQRIRALGRT